MAGNFVVPEVKQSLTLDTLLTEIEVLTLKSKEIFELNSHGYVTLGDLFSAATTMQVFRINGQVTFDFTAGVGLEENLGNKLEEFMLKNLSLAPQPFLDRFGLKKPKKEESAKEVTSPVQTQKGLSFIDTLKVWSGFWQVS